MCYRNGLVLLQSKTDISRVLKGLNPNTCRRLSGNLGRLDERGRRHRRVQPEPQQRRVTDGLRGARRAEGAEEARRVGLGGQNRIKEPQESSQEAPKAPQEPPRAPGRPPRGRKRSPRERPNALKTTRIKEN